MGKVHNNSIFKYSLVLCLSAALLLAQAGKLHMHLEHDDHSGSSAHVVDIHPFWTLHDFDLTNNPDEHPDDHSTAAVDVSPDTFLKNTNLLNPLIVIIFFVGLLLCIPRRTSVSRQKFDKTFFPPSYYLFQPPPRAPPVR